MLLPLLLNNLISEPGEIPEFDNEQAYFVTYIQVTSKVPTEIKRILDLPNHVILLNQ